MHFRLTLVLLLLVLAACATETQSVQGVPQWDLERDELTTRSLQVLPLLIGGSSATATSSSARQMSEGIELTPEQVRSLLLAALSARSVSQATKVLQLGPEQSTIATDRWGISDSNEGQLITDWRPLQGRRAGILWWEKVYEAEVRHVITVKQSTRSTKHSNIVVVTEVRERPNSAYPWSPGNSELGQTSFTELRRTVLYTVGMALAMQGRKK